MAVAAPPGIVLTLYEGLRDLPPFDPDVETAGLPESVMELRRCVEEADALVFACPEYAHGIPGAFKNALDWLVSGSEFPGKPVALFHASDRSRHGRDALAEVIRTMSAVLLPEFTLQLLGKSPDDIELTLAAPTSMLAMHDALAVAAASVDGISQGVEPTKPDPDLTAS